MRKGQRSPAKKRSRVSDSAPQRTTCDSDAAGAQDKAARSKEELFAWPAAVAAALCEEEVDEELRLRMRAHMVSGITLSSDYSGIDSPRECLEMVLPEIAALLQCQECLASALRVHRTCDRGLLPTKIQKQLADALAVELGESRPAQCHFLDIKDRLPQQAQIYVEVACPDVSSSQKERVSGYAELAGWIMQNRGWLFPQDCTSHCAIHQQSLSLVASQCSLSQCPLVRTYCLLFAETPLSLLC